MDGLVEIGIIFGHAKMRKAAKLYNRIWKSNIETITEEGLGFRKIIENLNPEGDISDDAIDLLEKLLCLDSNERITAEEAIKHKYFYQIIQILFFTYIQKSFKFCSPLMTNIVDYCTFKKTEKIKNILQIKEKYLINEIEILKNELRRVKEEINRVKSVPLLMGQFLEAIDKNTAIVSSSAGTNAVVKILSTVDKELKYHL